MRQVSVQLLLTLLCGGATLGCGRVLGISDLEYQDEPAGGGGSAGSGSGGAAGNATVCDPTSVAVPTASAEKVSSTGTQAPAVGVRISEPTFGTPLVRLTDENDGANCTLPQPRPVAPNGLSVAYGCGDKNGFALAVALLDTTSLAGAEKIPIPALPGGGLPKFEAQWDGNDAVIVHDGKRVSRFDVVGKTHSLIRDFSVELAGAELRSLGVSADGKVFAFVRGAGGGPYAVWQRDANSLENYAQPDAQLLELDPTGQWFYAQRVSPPVWLRVHEVAKGGADPGVTIAPGPPDYAPDQARASIIEDKIVSAVDEVTPSGAPAFLARSFNDPKSFTSLVEFGNSGEGLLRGMRLLPGWIAASRHNASSTTIASEMFLLSADGTQIRRLAQHRAKAPGIYVPAPHASDNGCTMAYVSNWGESLPLPGSGTGAAHVFVLDLRL